MTLAELLKWHRRQVIETDGCLREIHRGAVRLLTQVVAQRTRDSKKIKAGLERARAAGKKPGRQRLPAETEMHIRAMLVSGAPVRQIMAEIHCGAAVVYRVKSEMEAEADGD